MLFGEIVKSQDAWANSSFTATGKATLSLWIDKTDITTLGFKGVNKENLLAVFEGALNYLARKYKYNTIRPKLLLGGRDMVRDAFEGYLNDFIGTNMQNIVYLCFTAVADYQRNGFVNKQDITRSNVDYAGGSGISNQSGAIYTNTYSTEKNYTKDMYMQIGENQLFKELLFYWLEEWEGYNGTMN